MIFWEVWFYEWMDLFGVWVCNGWIGGCIGDVLLWLGLMIYFLVLFYFDGGGFGIILFRIGLDRNWCW